MRTRIGVFLLLAFALPTVWIMPEASPVGTKPNIILVMVDDADASVIPHMPTVVSELVQKGTMFPNFILGSPSCCPSRATFLRGQYPHNHRVFHASDFRKLARQTVATALHDAGYTTALIGKYLNGYRRATRSPPGWDVWRANVSSDVWARCLSGKRHRKCRKGNADQTLARLANGFVGDAEPPFFLYLAMNAPHSKKNKPPPVARGDRNKFVDEPLPMPPSFNEADVSDKPRYVKRLSPLNKKSIKKATSLYRQRLRSLQLVDRTIGNLIALMETTGQLDNTYIFFTTDNGHHLGQHRLREGKGTPYLEDVRFPLVVRGPGVPAGGTRPELVINTDFAPTAIALGEGTIPDFVDGRSIVPLLQGNVVPWRTAALIKAQRSSSLGRPAFFGLITSDGDVYVDYTGEAEERYDLNVDPYELNNIAGINPPGRPTDAELSARLNALSQCAAESCRSIEGQ